MTGDAFEPVRDHLAVGRRALWGGDERSRGYAGRILAVEHQLDPDRLGEWIGNRDRARTELETIVAELGKFKRPHGTTADFDPLLQPPGWVLLPGVTDAIDQLGKAVDLLR